MGLADTFRKLLKSSIGTFECEYRTHGQTQPKKNPCKRFMHSNNRIFISKDGGKHVSNPKTLDESARCHYLYLDLNNIIHQELMSLRSQLKHSNKDGKLKRSREEEESTAKRRKITSEGDYVVPENEENEVVVEEAEEEAAVAEDEDDDDEFNTPVGGDVKVLIEDLHKTMDKIATSMMQPTTTTTTTTTTSSSSTPSTPSTPSSSSFESIKLKYQRIFDAQESMLSDELFEAQYEQLLSAIVAAISNFIFVFHPTRAVFIAADGPAHPNKLVTQIANRIKNNKPKNRIELNIDDPTIDELAPLTSLVFSPGTQFMRLLETRIQKCFDDLRNHPHPHYRVAESVAMEYSGDLVAGEGEHKILEHIMLNGDADSNYIVVSNDSDMYMMSLVVPDKHNIYIHNDDFMLSKAKLEQNIWSQLGEHETNLLRVNLDFLFLSALFGNDYTKTAGRTTPIIYNTFFEIKNTLNYDNDHVEEAEVTAEEQQHQQQQQEEEIPQQQQQREEDNKVTFDKLLSLGYPVATTKDLDDLHEEDEEESLQTDKAGDYLQHAVQPEPFCPSHAQLSTSLGLPAPAQQSSSLEVALPSRPKRSNYLINISVHQHGTHYKNRHRIALNVPWLIQHGRMRGGRNGFARHLSLYQTNPVQYQQVYQKALQTPPDQLKNVLQELDQLRPSPAEKPVHSVLVASLLYESYFVDVLDYLASCLWVVDTYMHGGIPFHHEFVVHHTALNPTFFSPAFVLFLVKCYLHPHLYTAKKHYYIDKDLQLVLSAKIPEESKQSLCTPYRFTHRHEITSMAPGLVLLYILPEGNFHLLPKVLQRYLLDHPQLLVLLEKYLNIQTRKLNRQVLIEVILSINSFIKKHFLNHLSTAIPATQANECQLLKSLLTNHAAPSNSTTSEFIRTQEALYQHSLKMFDRPSPTLYDSIMALNPIFDFYETPKCYDPVGSELSRYVPIPPTRRIFYSKSDKKGGRGGGRGGRGGRGKWRGGNRRGNSYHNGY